MDWDAEADGRLAGLMRSAQDGDAAAYAELLRRAAPILRNAVRRQMPFLPVQDVEDIVQEVLLSLHAVRATYDPGRPFRPWLLAILRHRIADNARRHARRAAHEVKVERLPETISHASTNREEDGYGDPDALRRAIRHLPKGQREAIEMVKLRELSLKEAAERTGMSVGALKVAVHRAIKSLRQALVREA